MAESVNSTPLADRVAEWLRQQDEMEVAWSVASRECEGVPRPEVPEILLRSFTGIDGSTDSPPETALHFLDALWTSTALERLIEKNGFLASASTATPDGDVISITTRRIPLCEEDKARIVEMLAAAREYESAREASYLKCREIEDSVQARFGHLWTDGLAMIAEPAKSIGDLAQKALIVQRLDLIDGGHSDKSVEAMEAMFAEIIRMGTEALCD